ncbi:MAG: TIGR04282 family arsenosugar biosynthesis glycosyltransferase [Bryobacteraceae bacterium]
MRYLVVLFAKAPISGRVKTRLALEYGDAVALRLHQAFVLDVAACASSRFPIELHTDVETAAWPELTCPRRLQRPGDLGVRLYAALEEALARGWERVAILGTDAPDLPDWHVVQLFAADADVCFGPAEDGGFWGIACRRLAAGMFAGVPWSSPHTLSATVAACRASGLSVARSQWWSDVDVPADLLRLAASESLTPDGATAKLLRELHLRDPGTR